ncbi:unnamed protein product [Vitrella brassicaformis CCMP3155]|uniref:Uncharacterized protein n=1 Tax=Vitrella brassicaformis (strain CCMP3155) TaxID=1169540 RepID=A0A0G4EVI5_VITBC|nr:unnamed protein product [Vitrella brassicaformis CCMP3155]|eukprot:CEM02427.1 unnamed protein product [Vitrella brassicaformis CCMP3155]
MGRMAKVSVDLEAGPALPLPSVALSPRNRQTWSHRWSDRLFERHTHPLSCLLGLSIRPSLAHFKAWTVKKLAVSSYRRTLLTLLLLQVLGAAAIVVSLFLEPLSVGQLVVVGVGGLCLLGFVAVNQYYRRKIRDFYNIPESDMCDDFCCVLCCGPCTILQEYRHLLRALSYKKDKRRRSSPQGFERMGRTGLIMVPLNKGSGSAIIGSGTTVASGGSGESNGPGLGVGLGISSKGSRVSAAPSVRFSMTEL